MNKHQVAWHADGWHVVTLDGQAGSVGAFPTREEAVTWCRTHGDDQPEVTSPEAVTIAPESGAIGSDVGPAA